MILYTSQYRYNGYGRLDITVKGNNQIGRFFAPTWDMVINHKKTGNNQEYIDKYHALMLASYSKNRGIWDRVLAKDVVVLVCFCPANAFCHRHLLRHYLVKLGAEYKGEITNMNLVVKPEPGIHEPKEISIFRNQYKWLSNFYPVDITINGITYKSVEHYYQAMKFPPDKWAEIAVCDRPKQEGRKARLPADWDKNKDLIMMIGLKQKFQNDTLRRQLLSTGNMKLIEGNYWHDNYWGDCKCAKCASTQGLNKLGNMLMEIRNSL